MQKMHTRVGGGKAGSPGAEFTVLPSDDDDNEECAALQAGSGGAVAAAAADGGGRHPFVAFSNLSKVNDKTRATL